MTLAHSAQKLSTKMVALATAAIAVTTVIVLQTSPNTASFTMESGIDVPLPFGAQESSLQGKITYFGTRGGIDIYEVTYKNGEIYEDLLPDNIYLVYVPNNNDIIDAPMDTVMSAVLTGSRNVNYYGYKYSDAAATSERRDIAAVRFADRFPGQFFASNKARQEDGLYGNMLTVFEQDRKITFLKTDSSTGAVRLNSLGSLYALVVNEPGGAAFSVRRSGICGNNVLDMGEDCDDGNTNNADTCTNQCKHGLPIPFGSGSTATGAKMTVNVLPLAAAGTATYGQYDVPLLRFEVRASEALHLRKIVMEASQGTLSNASNYKLWRKTNGGGLPDVGDLPVSPQGSTVTFDIDTDQFNTTFGRLIEKDSVVIWEVRADIASNPVSNSLRLRLAQGNVEDYVGGSLVSPSVSLSGIRSNGICTLAVCQIAVTTRDSTLWELVPPAVCGNSIREGNEECDDGNNVNTDSCTNECMDAACGDTFIQGAEQCDDGNTNPGDGCSATCQNEMPPNPVCGDGIKDALEACDDGDATSGDGCSAMCTVEDGYSCTPASPSVCTEDTAPNVAPLTIKVQNQNLPPTGSATVGQQNVIFHRFSAKAGPAQILLKAAMFEAEVGSLGSLDNLSLWRDTNGDGTVDVKVLDKGSTSTATILVFFGADVAQNRLIAAGETAIFEVRGDIISGTPSTIRLGLKTNLANYIGGKDTVAQEDLGGIATNGSCLFLCDIEVTDGVSTTWNILETAPPVPLCGNEEIDGDEECDDGNDVDDDECSNICELTTPLPSF